MNRAPAAQGGPASLRIAGMDTEPRLPAPTIDLAAMRAATGAATAALRVLANEDRLMLLCQLTHGERSVGELEQLLALRQPTLSQQLAVLRTEGVVHTRREGKRIYYSVADPRLLVLLSTLHTLYCAAAE